MRRDVFAGVFLTMLAVVPRLYAEGPKPRKNAGVLVPCEGCNTRKTVELRLSRGERIKVDADGTTSWGYVSEDVDVIEKMGHLAVFGQSVQADRLVVLNLKQNRKKIVDLRYQVLVEARNRSQKKWLLIEDSGYRRVSPHAVWLVDLDSKTVATKMFDLFDPLLGGVSDPINRLTDDDGVGKMFWGPGRFGVLVTAQVGEHQYLYLARIVGEKVVVKKLPWDEQNPIGDEPVWHDDDTCEFRFKDGRSKRFDFRRGR